MYVNWKIINVKSCTWEVTSKVKVFVHLCILKPHLMLIGVFSKISKESWCVSLSLPHSHITNKSPVRGKKNSICSRTVCFFRTAAASYTSCLLGLLRASLSSVWIKSRVVLCRNVSAGSQPRGNGLSPAVWGSSGETIQARCLCAVRTSTASHSHTFLRVGPRR